MLAAPARGASRAATRHRLALFCCSCPLCRREGSRVDLRRLFSRNVELGLGPYIISNLQKTFLEPFQYSVLFLEEIFYTNFGTSLELFMCANHFCRHLQS